MKAFFNPSVKFEKYTIFAIIIAYAVLGIFTHRFFSFILIKAMILSIFALGYSLLFARTGLLSFGHAAFYAVGAYATGLIMLHISSSMMLAFLVAVAASIIISAIIGALSLIRTSIYFMMLTLAFGMGIYTVLWEWTSFTGGDNGLIGINRSTITVPFIGSISMVPIMHYYFFVLICFVVSVFVIYHITYSPFGLILRGIKENETRLKYSGFSPKLFALIAFIISGLFAGLAGSLDVLLENNASPDMAHWSASVLPIIAVLLGGIESFSGPIIGATILTLIITVLQIVSSENWQLWYGLIFVAIILGFRGGIVGFFENHIIKRN